MFVSRVRCGIGNIAEKIHGDISHENVYIIHLQRLYYITYEFGSDVSLDSVTAEITTRTHTPELVYYIYICTVIEAIRDCSDLELLRVCVYIRTV